MENPATWTPLHRAINDAFYHATHDGANAILKVLHAYNHQVTLDQVQAVVNRHEEQQQLLICGLSIGSMIVNELVK
jgi:hypothetical protein